MSRYTDLGAAYGAWRRRHIEHMRNCQFYVGTLARQLSQYIEAPDHFEDPQDGRQRPIREPYVQALEAGYDADGQLTLTVVGANQPAPDLIKASNGRWIAGIGLVIEMAANAWPKARYNFPIYFTINEGECKIKVGDEKGHEYVYRIDDPTGPHAVFDSMIAWLYRVYAINPGDTPPAEARSAIGFITYEQQ